MNIIYRKEGNIMKKIIAMLLLTATVISVIFVFASCTSNVGNEDVKDTTNKDNRVTTALGTNIPTYQSNGSSMKGDMRDMIKKEKEKNYDLMSEIRKIKSAMNK